MGQIAQRIHAFVQRASRHFVRSNALQMVVISCLPAQIFAFSAPQFMAQLRRYLLSASAAADNHDLFNGVSTTLKFS